MLYGIYRCLTDASGPLVPLLLKHRLGQGKEDPSRLAERTGLSARTRPAGRLLWVHGASVGETLGALPLIDRLSQVDPETHFLVTSGTLTSATMLVSRLPERASHTFIPLDRRIYVNRFLDHWKPDGVIWLESDLWPNMLAAIKDRGIPAVLVNARFSGVSARRWGRARGFFTAMMSAFTLVCPASSADAGALSRLAALPLGPTGNTKVSAPMQMPPADILAPLKQTVGDRPVWLAASTHEGEEAVVLAAHSALRELIDDALLILMPRHPARAPALRDDVHAAGLTVAQRSRDEAITPATAVYLADTMGEMPVFLALAPLTFVGGSIAAMGGHNPIEAADARSAILMGSHDWAFADVVQALEIAGGLIRVATAADMTTAVAQLLRDPIARKKQTDAASDVATSLKATVDEIAAAVIPHLFATTAIHRIGAAPTGEGHGA